MNVTTPRHCYMLGPHKPPTKNRSWLQGSFPLVQESSVIRIATAIASELSSQGLHSPTEEEQGEHGHENRSKEKMYT